MHSDQIVYLLYGQNWEGRRSENSSKCVHVDFSLHMGKGILYFLFCVEHMGKKAQGQAE